jgi:metallophosphoesterase superfamily enzyme
MILDSVISASFEYLGNISPRVSVLTMANVKNPFFLFAPWILFNHGIQVIMPALAALLTDTSVEMGSYLSPLLSAFFLNK